MIARPLDVQLLNACAALLLLVSFAMLAQRRVVALVNLLAIQGGLLCMATLLLAWRSGQHHLYVSAALTFASRCAFCVAALPPDTPPGGVLGHRADAQRRGHHAHRPHHRDLRLRSRAAIAALGTTAARNGLGVAVAVIFLAFITMITRRKAMSQVVGFLSMENGCSSAR